MGEQVTIEEIKSILRQYALIKDDDAINEALIDRVAHIIDREFTVSVLAPSALRGGPIELSKFGSSSSATTEAERGSSQDAAVGTSTESSKREVKSIEEQIEEVEAARRLPPPPPPSKEERKKNRPAEGQRATTTAQQQHFSQEIQKITAKIPDTVKSAGGLPEDYEDMVNESLNDDIEVSEGTEQVIDVADTDLQDIFGDSTTPTVANPKDAMALQRSLPRRLGGEGNTQGSGRSISRIE